LFNRLAFDFSLFLALRFLNFVNSSLQRRSFITAHFRLSLDILRITARHKAYSRPTTWRRSSTWAGQSGAKFTDKRGNDS